MNPTSLSPEPAGQRSYPTSPLGDRWFRNNLNHKPVSPLFPKATNTGRPDRWRAFIIFARSYKTSCMNKYKTTATDVILLGSYLLLFFSTKIQLCLADWLCQFQFCCSARCRASPAIANTPKITILAGMVPIRTMSRQSGSHRVNVPGRPS